jgi:hypothetical protein
MGGTLYNAATLYEEDGVGFIIASTRNGFCARKHTCLWKIGDDRFLLVMFS